MMQRWTTVLLVVLAAWRTQVGHCFWSADEDWITDKDHEAVQDAHEKALLYCKDASAGGDLDEAAARDALRTGIGGENIMFEILSEAESQEDILDLAKEKILLDYAWIARKVAPIVVAVLAIVLWPCCAIWSCCRCCRCGAAERKTSWITKVLLVVVLALIPAGLIVCVVQGYEGYANMKGGFSTVACSGVELLKETFNGTEEPYFVGFLPTLDRIDRLRRSLDADSDFMLYVNTTVGETEEMDSAVRVASETLKLLRTALQTGKEPKLSGNADSMHKCWLCEEALGPLEGAIQDLEDGFAGKLRDLQAEVKSQFSEGDRAEKLDNMVLLGDTLAHMKNYLRDGLGPLVDSEDGFKTITGYMESEGFWALNILFVCAFLLLTCAFAGGSCFVLHEKSGDEDRNPYCRSVHRCSCVVWQCGFLYLIAALFMGGLMNLITTPMSGLCMILDELSVGSLQDMSGAFGMENFDFENGTDGEVAVQDMLENCILTRNMSQNANLFKLLKTTMANGEKLTVWNRVWNAIAEMDDAFDALDGLDDGSLFSNSTSLKELRAMLANNPVDRVLLPVDPLEATYPHLALDARGSSDWTLGLQSGYKTGCACDGHNSEELASALPVNPVPGLASFQNLMETGYGALEPGSGCLRPIADCSPHSGDNLLACTEANDYVTHKEAISTQSIFRCDMFSFQGAFYDPKNMENSALWEDACDQVNVDWLPCTTMQRSCALAEFTEYVRDFDVRIEKAAARVDEAVAATKDRLTTGLKDALYAHFIDEIHLTMEGVNCGLAAETYRDLVRGLCFQGVVGMRQVGASYVASAVVMMLLMVVAYALWRRSVDNVNHWNQSPKGTSVVPMAPLKGGGVTLHVSVEHNGRPTPAHAW